MQGLRQAEVAQPSLLFYNKQTLLITTLSASKAANCQLSMQIKFAEKPYLNQSQAKHVSGFLCFVMVNLNAYLSLAEDNGF